MDSIYSGISSYYVFGLPLLMMFAPWVTFLKPLLWVALSLTLVLTGFACAGIALAMPRCATERGAVFMTAISLALFQPWIGLLIGFACAFLLVGRRSEQTKPASSLPQQEEASTSAITSSVR